MIGAVKIQWATYAEPIPSSSLARYPAAAPNTITSSSALHSVLKNPNITSGLSVMAQPHPRKVLTPQTIHRKLLYNNSL